MKRTWLKKTLQRPVSPKTVFRLSAAAIATLAVVYNATRSGPLPPLPHPAPVSLYVKQGPILPPTADKPATHFTFLHPTPPIPPLKSEGDTPLSLVGRQLFVDDALIERTTLTRTFHQATYHAVNPIVAPDQLWEKSERPAAMVYSDGVWYDPADHQFKMWYMCSYMEATCYAVSDDGIHWSKPQLDVEPGTNVVLRQHRDSATVWLDANAQDPAQRFKMFLYQGDAVLRLRVSVDGIHWSEAVAESPPTVGDRSTVYYDPFRKLWIYSLRSYSVRERVYRAYPNATDGLDWQPTDLVSWVDTDSRDPFRSDSKVEKSRPVLYNLDATPYESLMIGLFTIWQGDPIKFDRQKRNEVLLGFSRDGFHWERPDRRPFIGVNTKEGAWNWGNVQSAGGGFLVVGDYLYFYASGREKSRSHGAQSTGLAILRRDGFASMDAGRDEQTLTTKPVTFAGKHLFVNAWTPEGALCADILDEDERVVAPFTRENCLPVRANTTRAEMRWTGVNLASAFDRPSQASGPQSMMANGVQEVSMKVTAYGYEPSVMTIKAGVPVRWTVDGSQALGCTSILTIPSLGVSQPLHAGDNIITFTAPNPGPLAFMCSMGMVRGSFNVI